MIQNFSTREAYSEPSQTSMINPVGVDLPKVNNRNTRTSSGVFIVNFEHISHLALVFLLLTLNMQMSTRKLFAKIANDFQPFTVFAKKFILDVWLDPWCTSALFLNFFEGNLGDYSWKKGQRFLVITIALFIYIYYCFVRGFVYLFIYVFGHFWLLLTKKLYLIAFFLKQKY